MTTGHDHITKISRPTKLTKNGLPTSVVIVVSFLSFVMSASAVAAQMPDPRQMSGIPRPDGELPTGTITVRLLRGGFTNPLPGQTVELTGAGMAAKTAKSDSSGRAQFDGVTPGTRVRASTTIDGEKIESQEFDVPSAGGIRLMLVATDREPGKRPEGDRGAAQSAVPGAVALGQESRFVIEVGDDGLNVFNILQLVNSTQTPVRTPGPLFFELPPDATGAGILEGSAKTAVAEKGRISVSGPFPPGNTIVQFAYSLPFGPDSLTIRQKLPVAMAQFTILVQKAGGMEVSSPQMQQQREMTAEGQAYIVGKGPAVNAGDTIAIRLSGLPHEATWPRYLAVTLAVAILAAGAIAARGGGPAPDISARRRKLHNERDRLFGQLTALEEDRRQGRIDEQRYADRRRELLASLEGVYAQLDEGAAA
jgi:hypothetical protein